ncbi:hypothetical protein ACFOYW_18290 [Gryllotalpicola reticulitermitis]|uniref:Uncharacterized protein n=1 Tax=Gryllotalpicola reticulitermitis TaxID=1184153 RepID=A0ABV8QC88_9MICO
MIGGEMRRALERNRPIGRAGALAIADHLVRRYEDRYEVGGLASYVQTGDTRNEVLRYDYLALLGQPDVTSDDKQLIAWRAAAWPAALEHSPRGRSRCLRSMGAG